MKTNKTFSSLLSLALMMTTAGYARYQSAPLRRINTVNTRINTLKDESVFFNYKVLSKNDWNNLE